MKARVPATSRKGESKVIPIQRERRGARSSQKRAGLLGPGAHIGEVEAREGGGYRVRLACGREVTVTVGPGVEEALVEEAMRERRPVIVADGVEGACIFGALQTRAARAPQPELVLEAEKRLVLRVGRARVELLADGTVRISGQAATLDMPRAIRLLSALTEIP
ncbi:hypothetical protein [Polyangium jinanense]|uniref:Uncharacterized protein n=1 Tax=Polyangium jinanense TaxID=2829994 RepID=A0A9X3X235_9BACT|nr:hypothetical protein [Polyangium jinanense]MDC3955575.1 hypothetical protein [Polyangium jinanense]MDC3982217.1 hypothetical protein [Polyangium jinanense]